MKALVEKYHQQIARAALPELSQWTIAQAVAIQQIPSPTFHEARRAAYLKTQFESLGLSQTRIDEVHNVYGLLPGARQDSPGILISAHTDTVFSEDTDLKTKIEEAIIYGPGLGDNSIGVAGLLALIYSLKQQGIVPPCNLWLVATSAEEGLGDLKGMKTAFAALKDHVQCVINLEGVAFGHIFHAGIAVRRLRIDVRAEGGHSWLHFGRASAIHGLVALGARIINLHPPQNPRTTYNIGLIEGGHSVNSIATHASLWLDLRSEDRDALEALEQHVQAHIDAVQHPDLSFTVEIVGDRPAGYLSPNHPLVQGAVWALHLLGVEAILETGSTDGNIPLAANCPTVTIGITRGGNAHRLDEYIETDPIQAGLQQMITLVLAAAAYYTQTGG